MPRTSEPQLLLLDTHVWLWLVLGSEELGSAARTTIRGAGLGRRSRIAAITVWEIALLASRGRLVLGKRTIIWVEEAVAASTVSILPLSPSVAVESWGLPGTFDADPADRIIIATARMRRCYGVDPRSPNTRLRCARSPDGNRRLTA